jgi:phage baseplate assembly protein W
MKKGHAMSYNQHKRFPFQINRYGHVQESDDNDHLREMMEQILFTIPGERVNRPDFGCGIQMLVFGTTQSELIALKQSSVHAELQKYLGHLTRFDEVRITVSEDSRVDILIRYTPHTYQQQQEVTFTR